MKNKIVSLKENLIKFFKNDYIQRLSIIFITMIIIILLIFTPVYIFLDNQSYDLLMTSIKKPVKQDESLMLVDIDDNSMNWIPYSWPFPRKYHGDVVEVLADFGAKAVVFDVEFLTRSPADVKIEDIPGSKQYLAEELQATLDTLISKTSATLISPNTENVENLWNNFNIELSNYYRQIDKEIEQLVTDNDHYLSQRLKYFGKAFGTVNMLYLDDLDATTDESEHLSQFGYKKEALLKSKKSHDVIREANIAEFPYEKILKNYKKVGFTKVFRDKDGATRNIALFMEKQGYIIPQLALTPFLNIFDIKEEQIDFSSKNSLKLNNVKINDQYHDIKIPLINNLMRINWPSGEFAEIFTTPKKISPGNFINQHFSYKDLLFYKQDLLTRLENSLKNNFGKYDQSLEEFRLYNEYFVFNKEKERLIAEMPDPAVMKQDLNAYFNDYLQRLKAFVSDENIAVKEKEIDDYIAYEQFTGPEKEQWLQQKKEIRAAMKDIQFSLNLVIQARKDLAVLRDKICFIGLTATGTTDISPQPFDKDFENVGTHPSVFNTILQQDFIRIVPTWIIFALTILTFGAIVWFLTRRKAYIIASVGFFSTFIVLSSIVVFFRITNIYISPVIPFAYGIFSFLIMLSLKYVISESEKSNIRNAFNKYLSPAVIQDLLKDPSKLELGGERADCTAIFTDIEKFSSISEKFMDDPKGLVSLLNEYLSAMSDIILDNKGTIDKYEGDAIIGFFGKPVKIEDHPFRACLSSLRMKEIEDALNKKILASEIISTPLKTRIGINTGEMFIGNMGTTNKFNYTMIGHAVNLAARLEGVNKQYGTYQLISEYTQQYIKDEIITRKLDRVKVVNINTPIRLYELISLMEETQQEQFEFLKIYNRALEIFEKRKWKEALQLFEKAAEAKPDDGPVKVYLDRCRQYLIKPPRDNWDGVYALTVK